MATAAIAICVATSACSEGVDEVIWPLDFETELAEVRDCRLSPAAHDGLYIRVFADPAAATAYIDGVYPFAEGTLLVKGEYQDPDCALLERVSAMQRLADAADRDLGDWRWQRSDPSGKLDASTPARSCAGCHGACIDRDFACTDP